MKQFLLGIIALMISITAMASSDIKVKSGKKDFLKENAVAVILFDFSDARWEEKDSFKEWSGSDYDKRISVASENFVNSFNANTSGLKSTLKGDNAKYTIIFKVTNLERHQSFTGMWGQGKISVTGTISVINNETKEQICYIYIDGYGSSKDFNITDGIGKCFKALGKQISKLK